MPKLISIFSQIINEFEKQVQTLESVYPLISIHIEAGLKKNSFSYFQPACQYLEIRGRTLARVLQFNYYFVKHGHVSSIYIYIL